MTRQRSWTCGRTAVHGRSRPLPQVEDAGGSADSQDTGKPRQAELLGCGAYCHYRNVKVCGGRGVVPAPGPDAASTLRWKGYDGDRGHAVRGQLGAGSASGGALPMALYFWTGFCRLLAGSAPPDAAWGLKKGAAHQT